MTEILNLGFSESQLRVASSYKNILSKYQPMVDENETRRRELAGRLKQALIEKKVTQRELADACEVSEQAVGRWLRTGKIARDRIPKIAKKLSISTDFLLVQNKTVPDRNKGGPKGLSESNVEPGPEIRGMIPLISWVQAGDWCEAIDHLPPGTAEDWLPYHKPHGPRTFALRVRGISMEPEFHEGDIIIVDPDRQPENKKYVIAKLVDRQEVTFKQFVQEGGRCYLQALNPAWPDRIIKIDENTHICGVIIFAGRDL